MQYKIIEIEILMLKLTFVYFYKKKYKLFFLFINIFNLLILINLHVAVLWITKYKCMFYMQKVHKTGKRMYNVCYEAHYNNYIFIQPLNL